MRTLARTGVVAGGVSALVLGVGGLALGAPAPSSAVPTAADGRTVACTAVAEPLAVVDVGAFATRMGVSASTTVTCAKSADIHRMSTSMQLYEVMSGGVLRPIQGAGSAKSASADALTAGGAGISFECGTELRGTRTYVVRTRVNVKQTTTTAGTPFVAKLSRKQTLTCP